MKYGLEYWQHSLKLYYYQKQLLEIKKKKQLQWGPQIIIILNNALLNNQMSMCLCLCHPAKESSVVSDVITTNQSVVMFCNRLNKTTLISAVKRTCGLPCAFALSNLSPLHFSTGKQQPIS